MHPFVFALVQNQIIWCKIGNNLSNATNRCDMSSYVCIRSYRLQNGLIYILQFNSRDNLTKCQGQDIIPFSF